MALGFCSALVAHLKAVAECNTPSSKITPGGFLRSLLENRPRTEILNAESALKLSDNLGHIRDVILKYRKRGVPDAVATSDNCDIDVAPQYNEVTLPLTKHAKYGIYISDEDLARYCADATTMRTPAGWNTPFMNDFIDAVMEGANAVVGKIDQTLLTEMLTKFGINAVTGTNAATTVNINPDANSRDLNEGITKILADAAFNEMCGNLMFVGSGLFNNYELQNLAACCAANGIDTSRFTGYTWYHDLYAADIWGANQIGVFSSGSVGFIDIDRYRGWRAGRKGTSEFFNAPLPVDCPQCNGGYDNLRFDMQLRYVDCPTLINVGCEGERVVDRGYILYISKSYDLFTLPTDAYQHTAYGDCYNDRLAGNNGSLRYVITNA